MVGLGTLALLGAIWLVVTALLARTELNQARRELTTMRAQVLSGDVDAATANARSVERHAERAHSLTTGPAWAISAAIPYLGEPVQTARGATRSVHVVARGVLEPIVALAPSINPTRIIHKGGHVDLEPIVRAAPTLDAAAKAGQRARDAVARLPAHTWLGAADKSRRQLLDELTQLSRTLSVGATTAKVAPKLLGVDGPQRYFIGLLNNAEARGLGGLPGAFVIVVADNGTIRSTHFESDTSLEKVDSDIDPGAEYVARYGAYAPTRSYANSTIGPNFPDAARIWAAMWQKYSGEQVAAAISVDPSALSYLLKVTGPATLPDGDKITAANFVQLTEEQAYARYPDVPTRKEYLLNVARAVDQKVLSLDGDAAGFVKAAARAVNERRLLLWSSDADVRADLGDSPIAGRLSDTTAPFALMSVTNAAGSKLDYYLDRSLSWTSSCGSPRTVTVEMTLTNDVPNITLPTYVTIRADKPPYPTRPGDNRLIVNYFATAGATLEAATLDGKPTTVRTGIEHGHPVFYLDVELPRDATRKIVLTLSEPGSGPPTVVEQPLVRTLKTSVLAASC